MYSIFSHIEPPKRSPRYHRRLLTDSKDEYTAKTLYQTCAGKLCPEEAHKLVDVYGRKEVGRAYWWMQQLMAEGKIDNPPEFFEGHMRGMWRHVYGTLPRDYTQPPKRNPRQKPYDCRTDPIWKSES